MSFSHTALRDFGNCPLSFYHKRILKDVAFIQGAEAKYGEEVHKHFENRIKLGTPLPLSLEAFNPTLAHFDGKRHEVELQMAINDKLEPTEWFAPDAWIRGIADVMVWLDDTTVWIGDWKGLPLDTPLPTPSGWTTMRDVVEGDKLLGGDGSICTVVGKSAVNMLPCYRVVFDDTTIVDCDENHLWKLHDGRVVPITALHTNDLIATAEPLELPPVPLPIDPYILGLWLADGKHTSGEITKPDPFVWEEIERRGAATSHNYSTADKCETRTVLGLRTKLRENNLLGNKHIPLAYLRGSVQQRLSLLQGLMDGDGNANPTRKQAIFTTTDKALSNQVMELLLTLGQRPLQSIVVAHGFGKWVEAYPISFRPRKLCPFLLPRKADQCAGWGAGYSWRRRVVSVTALPAQLTQCVAVDSDDHTFLCGNKFVPTHNTGKRRPDFDQLELFSLLVWQHYPEIQTCKTSFVWTKDKKIDTETFTRANANKMWENVMSRIRRVYKAQESNNWPAKPSGLCSFCDVAKQKGCVYAR
jgi:hypothetical protein